MKAKKLYPDKSIKRIWNKIKDLEKNGTGSGGSGSGSTNGTVLVLLANNWVEQSDGTFTNTIPMSEFTSNMMVEIDLYNDGSLTETQITEYNSYISKFNINDGEIVAIATTQPTQTMSIICRGDFSISEDIKVGNLSQVMEQLDEQNKNFASSLEWNLIASGDGTHDVDNLSKYKEVLLCCYIEDDRILATTTIPQKIIEVTIGKECSNGHHQAVYVLENRQTGVDFTSNTSVTLYSKGSDVIPKLYGR